jgi:hypothetical protein
MPNRFKLNRKIKTRKDKRVEILVREDLQSCEEIHWLLLEAETDLLKWNKIYCLIRENLK